MSNCSLHYFGHSAICLELVSGKQILIDPFLSDNPLCPKPTPTFPKLEAICLTHGHPDHVGDTIALAKDSGCKVYATYELATLLIKEGVPESSIEFMNKGGSIDAGEYRVTLEQAFHSNSFSTSDGQLLYAGEAGSIIIEVTSGPCVYHAGDTQLFSDMALLAERFRPDLALLPIGDRYTMGPKDAARAAKLLGVAEVVPIHFATFDGLTGTPEAFGEALETSDVTLRLLKPGDSISIARGSR